MKNTIKIQNVVLPFIIGVFVLIYGTSIFAGELEPSGPPAPTMYSLEEIYQKVDSLGPSTIAAPASTIFALSTGINATFEGASSGQIIGSCTLPGREDTVTVIGFNHALSIPFDQGTGRINGHPVYLPVTIVKYVDKATPRLYTVCLTGELLSEVIIRYYRISAAGQEINYYTIELENALIVQMESEAPNVESLSLVFERMTWRHEETGVEGEAVWGAEPQT